MTERTESRITLELNFHYLREGNFSGKQPPALESKLLTTGPLGESPL